MRNWLSLVVASLVVVVSFVVGGWSARAQTPTAPSRGFQQPLFQPGQQPAAPINPFFNPLPEPRIVSGDDVGFRVEGVDGNGRPVGQWVVRVNGKWLETTVRPVPRSATN